MLALAAAPAFGQATSGEHSDNMEFVKNLPYELRNGATEIFGTDIEFARLGGRQYALAGSYKNGMQIVDITNPRDARIASRLRLRRDPGRRPGLPPGQQAGPHVRRLRLRHFGDGTSTCYQEAAALGFDVQKSNGPGRNGSFIAEITDPLHPRPSLRRVTQGAHNGTVHPSGNYLYNSNSDLITSFQPAIEVFDISNFAAPLK